MENPVPVPVPFIYMPTNVVVLPFHPYPTRILLQKRAEELEELRDLYTQLDDYKTMLPEKCIWTFPLHNLLKLNTDGSSKGNPGPSSYGGLIRDRKGRWLRGYIGKMNGGTHTALEAELWSIVKGLCLIKDMNLSFVLIETDCLVAVRLMVKHLKRNHPLRPVIDDIKGLMTEQRCTIVHTKRDGNHCADQLAKLGGKQSEEAVLLEEPPALLIPYLLRDMEAASEFEINGYHHE